MAGEPIVDSCLAGYNSSIFAYGQTGSGKTHTMLGSLPGGGEPAINDDVSHVFCGTEGLLHRGREKRGRVCALVGACEAFVQ